MQPEHLAILVVIAWALGAFHLIAVQPLIDDRLDARRNKRGAARRRQQLHTAKAQLTEAQAHYEIAEHAGDVDGQAFHGAQVKRLKAHVDRIDSSNAVEYQTRQATRQSRPARTKAQARAHGLVYANGGQHGLGLGANPVKASGIDQQHQ